MEIPFGLVVLFWTWADVMWILYERLHLPFNARPLIVTAACEICLYLIFIFVDVDIFMRAQLVRASLIIIALSMAFPLTLAFLRSKKKWNEKS